MNKKDKIAKFKKHPSVIKGDKTYLRLLQEGDIERLRCWRNKDRDKFIYSGFISREDQKKWFKGHRKKEDDLMFIIGTLEGKPIGAVALYKIDLSSKQAEFGRLIIGDVENRRKGFAQDASETLLRFGFSNLGLEQIRLEVLRNNEVAIRLYEKIGFQRTPAKGDHAADLVAMVFDRDRGSDFL